ncbi:MAG: glycosyltransferase [Thiotrichaceae bacterium]
MRYEYLTTDEANLMKTIVLHDYFEALEGGGRLCSILARGIEADLGCGFARQSHPFLQDFKNQLIDLKSYSRIPLWRQFKLARHFAQHTQFLANYDTVIYSGFYTPLAIAQHLEGKNILYCHTPPRFIYDQRDFYLAQLSPPLRPLLQAFIRYLQPRYEAAIAQMDVIITNSTHVRDRIRHYLGKEAQIVHPPCETSHFRWLGQKSYYLSTARLDPLKQVDKIIQAFLTTPDKHLIVASGGSELSKLQQLARNSPHIHFTGWTTEAQLTELMGNAIATLYLPTQEDFGMSPLESMAAGKPVIGLAEGGLLETIVPGKTGILLAEATTEAIRDAVNLMTPEYALSLRTECEIWAQNFRSELFLQQMQNILVN